MDPCDSLSSFIADQASLRCRSTLLSKHEDALVRNQKLILKLSCPIELYSGEHSLRLYRKRSAGPRAGSGGTQGWEGKLG